MANAAARPVNLWNADVVPLAMRLYFLPASKEQHRGASLLGGQRHPKGPVQSVPLWLRDAHSKAGRDAVTARAIFTATTFQMDQVDGNMLEPLAFYEPGANGAEEQIQQRLNVGNI